MSFDDNSWSVLPSPAFRLYSLSSTQLWLEANSLCSGKRVRGIGGGGKLGQFSTLENLCQSELTSTILRALREHLYIDHAVGRLSGNSRQKDYLLNQQGYLAFHFNSLCVIPSPTFPWPIPSHCTPPTDRFTLPLTSHMENPPTYSQNNFYASRPAHVPATQS
ncbi:hypothetical protein GYMLUDRAFT_777670 [Collybiopsis luxurians FD-317 M1]|uniref:Uncharacterized protein n=1 Tax=Collybiopsis luxurians FD-317 M1 TaxID=944289 RepID=A0A0D0CNV4_9AGAR|nr:hypothetical protein GYMLUDRAFT_777670 [Collybiopsis luxurians FD-317 M1]